MSKKYYIKPLIEVLEMDMEELMKVGSVTNIITEGLDDDLIPPDTDPDDLWEEAM